MTQVAIIKVGNAVPGVIPRRGDFERWIADGMGLAREDVLVINAHQGDRLPDPSRVGPVVVTGSAAMVTSREPWSVETTEWLRRAVEADNPVLAICYGHQLLAEAFGGAVDDNPRGRQIGTVDVRLTDEAYFDPLFADMPRIMHLPVSHTQSIVSPPAQAEMLAWTPRDPYHAMRVAPRAWGVQFHPDFDADIVRGYIAERRDQINSEGLDADALAEASRDTKHGRAVLRRFRRLI